MTNGKLIIRKFGVVQREKQRQAALAPAERAAELQRLADLAARSKPGARGQG